MDSSFPLSQSFFYLSTKDVLTSLIFVSKLWNSLCTADFLWAFYLERDLEVRNSPKNQSIRSVYYQSYVKKQTIRVFHPIKARFGTVYYPKQRKITWKPVQTPPKFPFDPTIYPLSTGFTLIIGGERYLQPAPDVYSLNESTMTVERLENLLVPRTAGGVVELNGVLYVFGGMNRTEAIADCELFDLNRGVWTETVPMIEAKAAIYPLKYHQKVFVSGVGSRLVELFDVTRLEFEPLLVMDNGYTHIAFWYGGEVVFMDSFGKYTHCDPASGGVVFRVRKETRAEKPMNTQVATVAGTVLYPSIERGGILSLYELDVGTMKVEKVLTEDW